MKKFRLPRKIKKTLKKGFWFYPIDEKNCYQMAFPYKRETDYQAYKEGILSNIMNSKRKKRKEFWEILNKEVFVTDEVLRTYVEKVFDKAYHQKAFRILLEAKNSKKAILQYYNFINANQQYEDDDNKRDNLCCMIVDTAEEKLKKKYKKRFRSKKS